MKDPKTEVKLVTVKSDVDLIVIGGVEHKDAKGKDFEVDATLVDVLLAHKFIKSQE